MAMLQLLPPQFCIEKWSRDIVIVDINGNLIEGEKKQLPRKHCTRYFKARPDVNAVVQTIRIFNFAFSTGNGTSDCMCEFFQLVGQYGHGIVLPWNPEVGKLRRILRIPPS
jgi:ribulose-5-phosphate 4-epimerase/fuculose-1-phosphate aldolase